MILEQRSSFFIAYFSRKAILSTAPLWVKVKAVIFYTFAGSFYTFLLLYFVFRYSYFV